MKPIGLMFKHSEVNPFTGRTSGDLMIIHECAYCGKISGNRISGDDCAHIILAVLDESLSIGDSLRARLANSGMYMLTHADTDEVRTALFGRR